MKKASTSAFHGYTDAQVRPNQRFEAGKGWGAAKRGKHLIVKDRELSYRFYAHFHPYAGHLVRRLVAKSVRGLQAMDTEYAAQTLPDGKPRPVLYAEIFSNTRYELHLLGARRAVRFGRPRPLFPASEGSGGKYPLRGGPVYRRQLHPDPAQELHPEKPPASRLPEI
jgi:hypothetical protein